MIIINIAVDLYSMHRQKKGMKTPLAMMTKEKKHE
jgi:hypothetical protein